MRRLFVKISYYHLVVSLPMKFSTFVSVLSLAQAGTVQDTVTEFTCGTCCDAFEECKNVGTFAQWNECVRLLSNGCNPAATVTLSVTLETNQVCPAPATSTEAADYVTLWTSQFGGDKTWSQYFLNVDQMTVSNVLLKPQNGCTYTMIAYLTPSTFPTTCSSPAIDANSEQAAPVELTPADSGSEFTLKFNPKLHLTLADYISLKASGTSCTPFTVQSAPALKASFPVVRTDTSGVASLIAPSLLLTLFVTLNI